MQTSSIFEKVHHIMKMNPVVHFEMPAENRKRMGSFYASVFGWEESIFVLASIYVLKTPEHSQPDGK